MTVTAVLAIEILIDEHLFDSLQSLLSPLLPMQTRFENRIEDTVRCALDFRGYRQGEVAVRVTDDATIRQINRIHLGHDYETDVISFAYLAEQPCVHGELVVSLETAANVVRALRDESPADARSWSIENEVLLYVAHGVLHLTGLDDQSDELRREMRGAEREILGKMGIKWSDAIGPDGEVSR